MLIVLFVILTVLPSVKLQPMKRDSIKLLSKIVLSEPPPEIRTWCGVKNVPMLCWISMVLLEAKLIQTVISQKVKLSEVLNQSYTEEFFSSIHSILTQTNKEINNYYSYNMPYDSVNAEIEILFEACSLYSDRIKKKITEAKWESFSLNEIELTNVKNRLNKARNNCNFNLMCKSLNFVLYLCSDCFASALRYFKELFMEKHYRNGSKEVLSDSQRWKNFVFSVNKMKSSFNQNSLLQEDLNEIVLILLKECKEFGKFILREMNATIDEFKFNYQCPHETIILKSNASFKSKMLSEIMCFFYLVCKCLYEMFKFNFKHFMEKDGLLVSVMFVIEIIKYLLNQFKHQLSKERRKQKYSDLRDTSFKKEMKYLYKTMKEFFEKILVKFFAPAELDPYIFEDIWEMCESIRKMFQKIIEKLPNLFEVIIFEIFSYEIEYFLKSCEYLITILKQTNYHEADVQLLYLYLHQERTFMFFSKYEDEEKEISVEEGAIIEIYLKKLEKYVLEDEFFVKEQCRTEANFDAGRYIYEMQLKKGKSKIPTILKRQNELREDEKEELSFYALVLSEWIMNLYTLFEEWVYNRQTSKTYFEEKIKELCSKIEIQKSKIYQKEMITLRTGCNAEQREAENELKNKFLLFSEECKNIETEFLHFSLSKFFLLFESMLNKLLAELNLLWTKLKVLNFFNVNIRLFLATLVLIELQITKLELERELRTMSIKLMKEIELKILNLQKYLSNISKMVFNEEMEDKMENEEKLEERKLKDSSKNNQTNIRIKTAKETIVALKIKLEYASKTMKQTMP